MVFALQVTRTGNLAAGAPSVPGSTQSASLRYLHHDHLGSVAAITDGTTGQVIERLAFDPWGKRRNVDGKSDTTDSLVGLTTDRGYTEHEHLDEMGIIHMNGRVYDPLVGRMMSADPFIQMPYNLKTFNRYAYVWNNPLKLYDPDGFNAQDTVTGSFVGTTTPSSPPSSSSPRPTPPANCTGSCNAAPPAPAATPVVAAVTAALPAEIPSLLNMVRDFFSAIRNLGGSAAAAVNPAVTVAVTTLFYSGSLNSNEQAILDNRNGATLNVKVEDSKGADKPAANTPAPDSEQTPTTNPENFDSIKGEKGKIDKDTGEVWERDQLHKNHWEVYDNKKDYEKGKRDRDVWDDGRPKRKF